MTIVSGRPLSAFFRTLSLLSTAFVSAQVAAQQAELTTVRGVDGETFGLSVAISGNTLVVGAPGALENGEFLKSAAFVFANSTGTWTPAAKLLATNAEIGGAVAISGDGRTIVVGNGRKAFVFVEPSTGWANMTQTAELRASAVAFGASVAISSDGRIVAVGALNKAFLYEKPTGGWVDTDEPTAALAAPSGAVRFGSAIAIAGDTAVVTDPVYGAGVGAVFLYNSQPGLRMIPISATLTASDSSAQFGYSVAGNGGTIVAGSIGNANFAGALYVFVRPPGGWANMTQTAELTVPTTQEILLGDSVAISGNTIIAGAKQDTIGHNADQGAVFGYLKPPGGWVDTSMPNLSVTGSDSTAGDNFGYSVALSGITAVIGAPFHAVNGNAMQGAAYVFGAK
jgi:hypothetical protein